VDKTESDIFLELLDQLQWC